jgi:hypothetical protein
MRVITIGGNRHYIETRDGFQPVTIGKKLHRRVICPSCGAIWFSNQPRATYCSNACRQQAYRQRRKRQMEEHNRRMALLTQRGLL